MATIKQQIEVLQSIISSKEAERGMIDTDWSVEAQEEYFNLGEELITLSDIIRRLQQDEEDKL